MARRLYLLRLIKTDTRRLHNEDLKGVIEALEEALKAARKAKASEPQSNRFYNEIERAYDAINTAAGRIRNWIDS